MNNNWKCNNCGTANKMSQYHCTECPCTIHNAGPWPEGAYLLALGCDQAALFDIAPDWAKAQFAAETGIGSQFGRKQCFAAWLNGATTDDFRVGNYNAELLPKGTGD